MSYETAPGQAAAGDHVNFEGRSIVVYREFESGARRVAVDLDVAKTVCKATVINGRRSGKTLVPNTAAGERIEVSSVQIGAVNCSIRDGNVFGQ